MKDSRQIIQDLIEAMKPLMLDLSIQKLAYRQDAVAVCGHTSNAQAAIDEARKYLNDTELSSIERNSCASIEAANDAIRALKAAGEWH